MLAGKLGEQLLPGRIYAGQAGATAWPSGTRRVSTLGSRIGTNHLKGSVRGSTFRLTLGALLRGPLDLQVIGDRRLAPASEKAVTRWMDEHLSLAVHPCSDPDTVGEIEHRVLAQLDPPLNLEGMPTTGIRVRLSELRRVLRNRPGAPPRVTGKTIARPTPPVARPATRVTLHEEIADILREGSGGWTSTQELADAVNRRDRYSKGDGSAVTAFQIHGRTRKYANLFERDGTKVRLRES